jgi:signal peptide peptidase SppA
MMTPNPLAHLAHRPLAILPSAVQAFALRFTEALQPDASRMVGQRTGGGYRIEGDVAIINITSALTNRLNSYGLISYEWLGAVLESAARDPKVKAILIDCDSPGGEAAGAFELAAQVRRINSAKPVVASVNAMACSAAFAIASGAKSITTIPSGVIGSIGVVALHLDASRMVDKAGVTPTFVFAGKRKIDGNSLQPLIKEARDAIQADVDKYLDLFIQAVAAGRGSRLTTTKARATEAATFLGKDAVAAGLADALGVFDDALVAARRAGVGATAHVVKLPAAAALPAPAAQTKPDVAAGNHGWDDIVAKVDARQAQPKPAPTSSVSKKEVATAFARSIARIKGEPSDKRIGFGWDEIIERQNARHARERGIRK